MCVYIKNNPKSILLLFIILFFMIRNLILCVYYMPASEFLCESNISLNILPNMCHQNKDMDFFYLSEELWIREDEIHHYLCNETFIDKISCIDVTTNEIVLKKMHNIPVSECIPINNSFNPSISFDMFYNLKNNKNFRYKIITCNFYPESDVSTSDKLKSEYGFYSNSIVGNVTNCIDGHSSITAFTVHLSCNELSHHTITQSNSLRVLLEYVIFVFIILIHVITIITFQLVPRLQAGYGKAVMSYVFAQLIRKVALIVMLSVVDDIHEYQKITISGAFHFSADLIAHLWQIFITFQIWTAFKCTRQRQSAELHPKTFVRISAVIWVVPCFLVTVYFIISDRFLSDRTFWVPASICETSLLMSLELTAMLLSGATLLKLRASRTCRNRLKGTESRSHNTAEVQWSSLYMKIVLLAGADYVFVMVFFVIDNVLDFTDNSIVLDITYYFMWDIYSLRGVEMFFIFVLKNDVWEQLKVHVVRKHLNVNHSMTNI